MFKIELYSLPNEKQTIPYIDWLKRLRDTEGKIAIVRRLMRLENGNFGDYSFCREGIFELRIDTGPGYRVYYFHSSPNSILILRAGKKATQNSDIDLAISYKRDWQRRSVHEQ
jgi:putative addiction module killer protein